MKKSEPKLPTFEIQVEIKSFLSVNIPAATMEAALEQGREFGSERFFELNGDITNNDVEIEVTGVFKG